MQSKLKLLLLLLFTMHYAFSQQAKLNPSLLRELAKDSVSTRVISLLVEGDVTVVEQETRALGGTFKFSVKNFSSISLPLNRVPELAKTRGVLRVEGLYGTGQLMDEMTLLNANVNPVHSGAAPLSQEYDGSGVVVAILDDGIDWHHPDFKNADGTTRIKFIYDQNSGEECDAATINSGQCPFFETTSEFGHGSNVAGIAAGNGLATNNYEGVAPKADIICVAIAFDENFLGNVVDATQYAFEKADLLGEPCVINASVGTYFGSHDGYDLVAQMIDALITQENGRVFVCAGGNAGNQYIPFHLGYETSNDSSFTWFAYNTAIHKVFFEWWIDKDAATNFYFSIGADSVSPFKYLGRTKYYNLVTDFSYVNDVATKKDTLWHNGTRVGIITFTAYRDDSTYACDVSIKPDVIDYDVWRFITNGTGRFDLWSSSSVTGTSDMVIADFLPDELSFPDIVRYKTADSSQSIVGSFSCSDKVITVANYTNRQEFIDYYGYLQSFPAPTGSLSIGSSVGPTRDGRIKPEIAAPGDLTLSCGLLIGGSPNAPVYEMDLFILNQSFKVAPGGMHLRNGGTSMASPVVAGVAALYLQKNPNANWKEVKDAIELCATHDNYTGNNLPDTAWGYGKVNAFCTLMSNIVYGCTNPAYLNFNPLATVDDGSCEFAVGVDDPLKENSFACYPNPTSAFTTFFFNLNDNKMSSSKILIADVQGKILDELNISSKQMYITYNTRLPSGLYFCRLQTESNTSRIIKLLVQQ